MSLVRHRAQLSIRMHAAACPSWPLHIPTCMWRQCGGIIAAALHSKGCVTNSVDCIKQRLPWLAEVAAHRNWLYMWAMMLAWCAELCCALSCPAPADVQTAIDIDGHLMELQEFAGKVTIFVNVASKCGYTDANYKGEQAALITLCDSTSSRSALVAAPSACI